MPLLIALCETWLSDNDPTEKIYYGTTLIFCKNRSERGGGVSILLGNKTETFVLCTGLL